MIVIETWFFVLFTLSMVCVIITLFFLTLQIRNLGGWVHTLSDLMMVRNKQDHIFEMLREKVKQNEEEEKMVAEMVRHDEELRKKNESEKN